MGRFLPNNRPSVSNLKATHTFRQVDRLVCIDGTTGQTPCFRVMRLWHVPQTMFSVTYDTAIAWCSSWATDFSRWYCFVTLTTIATSLTQNRVAATRQAAPKLILMTHLTDADAHHISVPGESMVGPKAHVFQLVRAALDHHRSRGVLGLLGIL